MTLKFNTSILVILNAENKRDDFAFSIQAYGRAEILDDTTILESFKILRNEPWNAVSGFDLNGFTKKYIGFKIHFENAEEVNSLRFSLRV
jgi:hypothetical protein